jgi:hypothetical protein
MIHLGDWHAQLRKNGLTIFPRQGNHRADHTGQNTAIAIIRVPLIRKSVLLLSREVTDSGDNRF